MLIKVKTWPKITAWSTTRRSSLWKVGTTSFGVTSTAGWHNKGCNGGNRRRMRERISLFTLVFSDEVEAKTSMRRRRWRGVEKGDGSEISLFSHLVWHQASLHCLESEHENFRILGKRKNLKPFFSYLIGSGMVEEDTIIINPVNWIIILNWTDVYFETELN